MTATVNTTAELRALFGAPGELALACMKESMDGYHRRFIELSPFICLATSAADGQPFVSPKGDAPGFVKALDDKTLLIPDRPGNNKVESFSNIVENPRVSVIFFVPGLPETLRVLGTARLSTEAELLQLGKANLHVPTVAVCIDIKTVYFHCGKALVRSKFWRKEAQVSRAEFPSFGEVIKAQAQLDVSVGEAQGIIDEMYTDGLY